MSGGLIHLAETAGLWRAVRLAAAERTQALALVSGAYVYGDSRMAGDERDATELVDRDDLTFGVIVALADCRTVLVDTDPDRPAAKARRRRYYEFDLYCVQPYTGADGEDDWTDRIEALENGWGAPSALSVTLDDQEFLLRCRPLEPRIEPGFLLDADNPREKRAHICCKRLTLWEDRLCGS